MFLWLLLPYGMICAVDKPLEAVSLDAYGCVSEMRPIAVLGDVIRLTRSKNSWLRPVSDQERKVYLARLAPLLHALRKSAGSFAFVPKETG